MGPVPMLFLLMQVYLKDQFSVQHSFMSMIFCLLQQFKFTVLLMTPPSMQLMLLTIQIQVLCVYVPSFLNLILSQFGSRALIIFANLILAEQISLWLVIKRIKIFLQLRCQGTGPGCLMVRARDGHLRITGSSLTVDTGGFSV